MYEPKYGDILVGGSFFICRTVDGGAIVNDKDFLLLDGYGHKIHPSQGAYKVSPDDYEEMMEKQEAMEMRK